MGPTPFLTSRTLTRVATWNIRTMYELGRTIQVAREMKNYKIGILGLSKTRWLQASGEQLLYSGHTEDGVPHTEGVALMLAPEAQRALIGWEQVSSLIITVSSFKFQVSSLLSLPKELVTMNTACK